MTMVRVRITEIYNRRLLTQWSNCCPMHRYPSPGHREDALEAPIAGYVKIANTASIAVKWVAPAAFAGKKYGKNTFELRPQNPVILERTGTNKNYSLPPMPQINKTAFRRLRGYAFDPSLSQQLETLEVNDIIYKVEWEPLESYPPKSNTKIPTGEYIEIIDYDPGTGVFYPLVNLDAHILEDGLRPDVNNPQFHQQMVYAVIMTTIQNFEKALGRKIQWGERTYYILEGNKKQFGCDFVQRLRVYPHALRQANAYYHPEKKALLFGYFPAAPASPMLQLPGSTVFTCLSHDIIAHETTHAILDGLHKRYTEPSHPDTRAFHEAFADIVALFQHFTFPGVLKHQIAKTRGDLNTQNLLGQLAQEFGKAMGSYGSLRDAIGSIDRKTKQWQAHVPDPAAYQTEFNVHNRGAILVAAIFDAFLNIYKRRIQSLLRVATGGSGVLPPGMLHPDLVDLLAETAAKTAGHVLRICVRALDYCPPVEITFGDYLRAIVTADKDMVADDERDYRVAFTEAFQKRGIFPTGLKSMSVESLCFPAYPGIDAPDSLEKIFVEFLRDFKQDISYTTSREEIYQKTKQYIAGSPGTKMGIHQRIDLKFIRTSGGARFAEITGLVFPTNDKEADKLGFAYSTNKGVRFEVGNVWLASRVTPAGTLVNDVVVTLHQKRGVRASLKDNKFKITGYFNPDEPGHPKDGFIFRGGCTLIFDLDNLCLKYAIRKSITDEKRIEQQYRYLKGNHGKGHGRSYFDEASLTAVSGPFGFMHAFHNH